MSGYLPFVSSRECVKIGLEEILYVQKEGRVTEIVTESITYRAYTKMDELEPYLDKRFFRCLKNTVINFEQVKLMKDQTIFFNDGRVIMLGRENFIRTKQTFAIYIKNPCNSKGFIV